MFNTIVKNEFMIFTVKHVYKEHSIEPENVPFMRGIKWHYSAYPTGTPELVVV